MKKTYLGVVHKDADSDFSIHFPDIVGCFSAGETIEELVWMAHEALQFHIKGLEEDGNKIPEPSEFSKIVDENKDSLMLLPVTVEVQSPKKIKINITLPEDILYEIDSRAKNLNISRSALIAQNLQKTIGS
jgi:predicted RNase H-like HicB family nuclease